MSPTFWLHIAARHLLESIVADSRRCSKPFFKVTWFDQIPFAIGMMAPNASKTVGLQFHPNGKRVAFGFRYVPLEPIDFLRDAEKVLNVVADLVGDDIGLCEITGGAESLRHLLEK